MGSVHVLTDAASPTAGGAPAVRLRRLLAFLRPYRGALMVSLGLLLGMSAAVNALPWWIRHAIDRWIVPDGLSRAERLRGLALDGRWFLGMAAVAFGLRFLESLWTAWIGQRVVQDVRRTAFRTALSLDLATFDRTPVGRLLTRLTSDVEAIQRFVTEVLVGGVADLFMLLGAVVFMLLLHPGLAALALLTTLPMGLMLLWVGRNLRRANRIIRARSSALNAILQEQLAGMATVQLYNQEAQALTRVSERSERLRDAQFDEVRWFCLYWPVLEFSQAFSMAAVLIGGLFGHWLGARTLSPGVIAAFLAYVRDFYRPLGALADRAGVWQQAMVSSERLFDLLDTPITVADPPRPSHAPSSGLLPIEFDHVWFAYELDHWILRDFTLQVRPGESVALVGPTGAGKTTVASLLVRWYDVQRGVVRIGGVDVREWPLTALRRRVGLVQQEPFIFSGTVAENIALGRPHASREAIEAAAQFVGLDALVRRWPRGYDTVLGERGGSLSAGERQLVALARMVLANPDVLVVFDEATANLDSEFEQRIQSAVQKMMHGRTTLIIAHRLATVRSAARIVVVRQGSVACEGTHEQLFRDNPFYRRWCELALATAGRSLHGSG